ncbi:MAG: glycerophosphodiester phosphodiesterase family protein, partial [Clostridia bacterium]
MVKVHAHRGASAYAPENTLASFQLAHDMHSDGIECDIHLTVDGVFVVCHDETIDRT